MYNNGYRRVSIIRVEWKSLDNSRLIKCYAKISVLECIYKYVYFVGIQRVFDYYFQSFFYIYNS